MHVSVVQTLLSLQTTAVPGWQLPPEQTSPAVHALPSLHGAVLLVWTQPVAGSQLSSVHGLPSLQFSEPVPGWQIPPEQTSPVVHAFPSLHDAALFVWTQPVAGAQESSVQGLPSSQLGAGPPTQAPPEHASLVVQAFPSLQAAPFALFAPDASLLLTDSTVPPASQAPVTT